LSLFIDWDTADITDDSQLDTVSRFLLSALLKHCGFASALVHSYRPDVTHFYRPDFYRLYILQLLSLRCLYSSVQYSKIVLLCTSTEAIPRPNAQISQCVCCCYEWVCDVMMYVLLMGEALY